MADEQRLRLPGRVWARVIYDMASLHGARRCRPSTSSSPRSCRSTSAASRARHRDPRPDHRPGGGRSWSARRGHSSWPSRTCRALGRSCRDPADGRLEARSRRAARCRRGSSSRSPTRGPRPTWCASAPRCWTARRRAHRAGHRGGARGDAAVRGRHPGPPGAPAAPARPRVRARGQSSCAPWCASAAARRRASSSWPPRRRRT